MTSSINHTICLAGSGWGFWAALNGLLNRFSKIELFNSLENELVKKFVAANLSVEFSVCHQMSDIDSNHIICAGFKDIVASESLRRKEFINIHYSLLPQYRGFHSTVWATINNEKYLGYTVHLMNEFIDDGPIIYQYKIHNDFASTATYYMEHFNKHIEQNLGTTIFDYLEKKITPVEQDKSKASWVGKRNKKDCQINFNSTINELKAFFRALNEPYPKPFFIFKENVYIPKTVGFHPSNVKTDIGRILNIDDEGIWIKISDGYVIFDDIVNEEGNETLKNHFKIGARLHENKC